MAELNAVLKKPFAEQVAFFRNKLGNLVPTAKWDDLQKAQHDTAFMVAGAQKADLLADLAASIDKAISQGTGLDAWRKDFNAAVAKHDWHGWTGESTQAGRAWRTRVTYQTNMQTSYAAGRFAQLQEGGFDYWVYHHSDGVKVPRQQHLAWDGLALPANDPFWQTHYPPNGWGCQCYVTGARNKELAEMHGADFSKTPPEGTEGIHKGWDYAPGASVANTAKVLSQKLDTYPKPIADALKERLDSVQAPAKPLFIDDKQTFSSVPSVRQSDIEQVLSRVPGAQAEMAKLGEFLHKHPIKTIFVTEQEMSAKNKAAQKLVEPVKAFLGDGYKWSIEQAFTSPKAKGTNGFTYLDDDHVTVKVKKGVDLSATAAEGLAPSVTNAISRFAQAVEAKTANKRVWSMRSSFDEALSKDDTAGYLVTWLHEVSHQIHAKAGMPEIPISRALTRYSGQDSDKYEWHAEHLTAYFLNRQALAQWDARIVQHLDSLIEKALKE